MGCSTSLMGKPWKTTRLLNRCPSWLYDSLEELRETMPQEHWPQPTAYFKVYATQFKETHYETYRKLSDRHWDHNSNEVAAVLKRLKWTNVAPKGRPAMWEPS